MNLLFQAMVALILQGDNTNCKEDLDEFLLSLDSLPAKSGSKEQVFQVQPSPYEAVVSVLPENVKGLLQLSSFQVEPRVDEAEELSFSESNVLAYIAGYIIRRLRGKMCNDCTSKLICSSESESDGKLEFIKLKKYAGAKDGLILPSKAVLDVLEKVEKEYRGVIDNVMYCEKVKTSLVSTILKNVNFETLYCKSCKPHLAIVHIMVNIRLHHTLKMANKSLRQQKGMKNRKMLKFAHL